MQKLWKPALLFATVGVMIFGMLSSGAWFTDTATKDSAEIYAGTLYIEDGNAGVLPFATITNMAPGQVSPQNVGIVIENGGSIDLAWFGDMIVSNHVLRDVIYIDYAKTEFFAPDGMTPWRAADEFIVGGNYIYNSPTHDLEGLDGYVTLAEWDDNDGMAPGTPYEFMGALKPDYQYKFTFRFGMLPSAGNVYQGAGPVYVSFEVDATQITAGALDALLPGLAVHEPWLTAQIGDQTE